MVNKDCENLHPLLSLYLEEKLSDGEKINVARHLSECPEAQSQMEEYRALRRLLLSSPEPIPPEDFHERILDYVYDQHEDALLKAEEGKTHRSWWRTSTVWGLAAAVVCMALFFSLFSNWREVLKHSTVPPVREEAAVPQARVSPEAASPMAAVQETPAAVSTQAPQPDQAARAPQVRVAKRHRAAKVWVFREESYEEDPFEGNSSLFVSQVSNRAMRSGGGVQSVSYGDSTESEPVARKPEARVVARVAASKSRPTVAQAASIPVVAAPVVHDDLPIVDPVEKTSSEATAGSTASTEAKRWSGIQSSYPEQHTEWVQDEGVLTAYWQLLGAGPAMPNIDFQKEGVAIIFLGTRPTGGYSVSVDGIAEGTDAVTVLWHEQSPSADGAIPKTVMRPWALQVFPHTNKPVVFIKR